jgi:hypothetical protein
MKTAPEGPDAVSTTVELRSHQVAQSKDSKRLDG